MRLSLVLEHGSTLSCATCNCTHTCTQSTYISAHASNPTHTRTHTLMHKSHPQARFSCGICVLPTSVSPRSDQTPSQCGISSTPHMSVTSSRGPMRMDRCRSGIPDTPRGAPSSCTRTLRQPRRCTGIPLIEGYLLVEVGVALATRPSC